MKSTDRPEPFGANFYDENALICNIGAELREVLVPELAKLDAAGKTVVITDSYLFSSYGEETYRRDVIGLLCGMHASAVIVAAGSDPQDTEMENRLWEALREQRCTYVRRRGRIHDRYWLCPESGKALQVGTSLNGVGRKVFGIQLLPEEDVQTLIDILRTQEILLHG